MSNYEKIHNRLVFFKKLALFVGLSYWFICSVIGSKQLLGEITDYMASNNLTVNGLVNQLLAPAIMTAVIVLGLSIIAVVSFKEKLNMFLSLKMFVTVLILGILTAGIYCFEFYLTGFSKFMFSFSLFVFMAVIVFLYGAARLPVEDLSKLVENFKRLRRTTILQK